MEKHLTFVEQKGVNCKAGNIMERRIVVGVAGMPGAGKSLVVETALELGFKIVVMGDEIREETKRRGLALTPTNVGKVMLKLRKEEGAAVVAKRCIPKIIGAKEKFVIVDGLRSLDEVNEFKKHFPKFAILAVHASPETRFQRLYSRKRSDDPKGWETFRERDLRELNVGLGNVIAVADYMIINEASKEEAKKKIREILEKVMENE